MRPSRNTLLVFIAWLISSAFVISCQKESPARPSPNALTEAKLDALMNPVKSWLDWSSKGYSSNDWANLIASAKAIQQFDPASVTNALRQYQLHGHAGKDFDEILFISNCVDGDSKLFLLMRVIFELPDSVPEHDLVMSGGWMPGPFLINTDNTANQSWPIKWNNGRPRIIAACRGLQGIHARYDACWEYQMLIQKYPLRDLSSSKQISHL